MPFYCYERPDGKIVERHFSLVPVGSAREQITCSDGVVAVRSFPAEHATPRKAMGQLWPKLSDACAVNPREVPAEMRRVPGSEFAKDGRQIFNSPGHEKRCLKAIGRVNVS